MKCQNPDCQNEAALLIAGLCERCQAAKKPGPGDPGWVPVDLDKINQKAPEQSDPDNAANTDNSGAKSALELLLDIRDKLSKLASGSDNAIADLKKELGLLVEQLDLVKQSIMKEQRQTRSSPTPLCDADSYEHDRRRIQPHTPDTTADPHRINL
jgi:hypothetical protein